MRNFGLKLFSLGIALVLAYFVHSQGNTSVIGFVVPVEIVNLPEEKVIVWPRNQQAQVTVKGSSFLVSRIAASPPAFRVKVPDDVEGHFVAPLRGSELGLPEGVEILNIEPHELEITLDDLLQKEVPLEVPRLGRLDEHLKLAEFSVEPRTVVVRGPESDVAGIERVETPPVDLRSIKEDTVREVRIPRPGPLSDVSAEVARVAIGVTSIQQVRSFPQQPIEIRSAAHIAYSVEPQVVHVEVSGPKRVVKDLKDEEVVPFVRVREPLSSGPVRVEVDVPPGCTAALVDPDKVSLTKVLPTEGGTIAPSERSQVKKKTSQGE